MRGGIDKKQFINFLLYFMTYGIYCVATKKKGGYHGIWRVIHRTDFRCFCNNNEQVYEHNRYRRSQAILG